MNEQFVCDLYDGRQQAALNDDLRLGDELRSIGGDTSTLDEKAALLAAMIERRSEIASELRALAPGDKGYKKSLESLGAELRSLESQIVSMPSVIAGALRADLVREFNERRPGVAANLEGQLHATDEKIAGHFLDAFALMGERIDATQRLRAAGRVWSQTCRRYPELDQVGEYSGALPWKKPASEQPVGLFQAWCARMAELSNAGGTLGEGGLYKWLGKKV